jgi:gliding motility-associated-like protein
MANMALNQYRIKLSVENAGGCADTSEITICYKDTVILYVPSAFTPNNDGLNDAFEWNSFGCSQIKVHIYNRWGEIIFKSFDLNGSWVGKINGNDCPEGIYIAYIEYRGLRVATKTLTQSIMLLRKSDK